MREDHYDLMSRSSKPYTAASTTSAIQTHLPTEAEARKKTPLWSGLVKYFPDALVAVAQLSQKGNDQHNPGQPLHWSREKSADHQDTLLRHLFDSGTMDVDGQRHSTKVAWRALAMLQLEIEKERKDQQPIFLSGITQITNVPVNVPNQAPVGTPSVENGNIGINQYPNVQGSFRNVGHENG